MGSVRVDVYVLWVSHKHGTDISVYSTEADAKVAAVEFALQWWDGDRADQDAPDDPAGLSADEILSAYFYEGANGEHYGIDHRTMAVPRALLESWLAK